MADGEKPSDVAFDATAAPSPALDATVSANTTDRSPPTLEPTLASADAPVARGPRELPQIDDGRYAIGAEIGRGGLGRVLRARDAVLERPVALKQLFATDEGSRRRFIREALITARLQHPSIVPVYEAGRREDRSPFYAMKLVAGQPLEREIASASTLDKRLALIPTVLAVADAIAYAHDERIIHRDLKPANILVGKYGETVVIDWGLAKDLAIDDLDALPVGPFRSTATEHTVAGAVMGTPGYMAPEQAAGEDADERADVYALGAILYHVISGALPHQGTTLEDVIAKVIRGDVKPLLAVEPNAPPDLAAIVGKAMAVDKARRYRDASALAEDLRKFQTGQLVGAHRYTTGERVRRWLRRYRAIVAVTAIALVVLIGFGVVGLRAILRKEHEASEQRDEAVAKSNRAILNQARSLRHDPARMLALLATMNPSGPEWDSARMLAADGLSQPRLIAQTRGPAGTLRSTLNSSQFELARGGRHALAYDGTGIWTFDLAAMTTRHLRHSNDGWRRLEWCDDGKLAFTMEGGMGVEKLFEIDLANERIQRRKGGAREYLAAIQQCDADAALVAGPTGLVWRDPVSGKTETLSTEPMQQAWFTPDRAHVIAFDRAGGLRRFDRTGKQLGAILGPEQPIVLPLDELTRRPTVEAKISDDGSAAIFRIGSRYSFWSFEHGRLDLKFFKDGEYGDSIAISPDGSAAYVTTSEGGHEIINRASPLLTVAAHVPRGDLAMAPDGRWMAAVDRGQVTIVDRATHTQQALRGHPDADHVEFTSDSKLLTGGGDSVRLWDLGAPGQSHGRLGVKSAAFSPDGRWLAIDEGRSIARWNVALSKFEAAIVREPSLSESVAIGDTGDVVFTVDREVFRWSGAEVKRLGKHEGTNTSRLSKLLPDGTPITVSQERVVLWRGAGPREIVLPSNGPARGITVYPFQLDHRGKRALVVCRPEGEVLRTCVIDLVAATVAVLANTTEISAITPDGKLAITGMENENYAIWDLERPAILKQPKSIGALNVLGISRDGALAIVGGLIGMDWVDLATLQVSPRGSAERTGGAWLQFSPDAKTVVGQDLVLRDVATGEHREIPREDVLGDPPAFYLSDTSLVVVTRFGIVTVRHDLPRDPVALQAILAALPYKLDEHDALSVKPITAPATGSR